MPTIRDQRVHEPADVVAARVIEPGEQVLWSGRPYVPALTQRAEQVRIGRSPLASIALTLVLMAAGLVAFLLWQGVELSHLQGRIVAWLADGAWVFVLVALGIVGAATALRRMGFDNAGAFIRRARSQTYAITDRRLLILDGDHIAHAFRPEELGAIRLRERGGGYADVELRELPSQGSSRHGAYAELARERRRVGFKALPDAAAVRARIEEWRNDHLAGAERGVDAFLQARTTAGPAAAGTARRIRNAAQGFEITVPADWSVKVRRRRRPFGMFALQLESWSTPEQLADWNVLRVEGPWHSAVEVHLDQVPRLVRTYEQSLNSVAARLLGGELVESDEQLRWGRFQGYAVTRRLGAAMGAGASGGGAGPALMRVSMLHDGALQLGLITSWPEASEPLRAATADIVDSISVATVPADRKVRMPSRGCLPALLTGLRVLVGLLVLGLGLFAGYDQSRRAVAHQEAQAELLTLAEQGIPELSPDRVTTEHDGTLAFLSGSLTVPRLEDPLTGFAIDGWRLARRVQLRQWNEIGELQRRAGGDSTTTYRYERVWSDDLIDSDAFQQPLFGQNEHVNPAAKPLPDEVFIGDEMRLGAWRLSPYYGVDIDRRGPVAAADLAAATLTDGWSAHDGFLYNDRYPDLRIHYLGHPVPSGRYGLLGVPGDGLLALDGPMAELPLIAADATDAASIIASVQGLERGVDPLWMAYTFVGLMILIRPLARPFPGLRGFTDAPLLRRLAITAAVAAGLTAVAALAMP